MFLRFMVWCPRERRECADDGMKRGVRSILAERMKREKFSCAQIFLGQGAQTSDPSSEGAMDNHAVVSMAETWMGRRDEHPRSQFHHADLHQHLGRRPLKTKSNSTVGHQATGRGGGKECKCQLIVRQYLTSPKKNFQVITSTLGGD